MSRGLALGLVALAALAFAALWATGTLGAVAHWAVERQRDVQNALAAGLTGLRQGEPGALAALLGASFSYGFLHAVGPGHGKALIGGAALGAGAGAWRMAGLAVASSLAQSGTAVAIVYGGLGLLSIGTSAMATGAEAALAPVAALAMGAVGAVLLWRGGRALATPAPVPAGPGCAPAGECGCGHRHGPTPEEAAAVRSWRDALALIAAVAVRPCTGALILLVLAWRMDLIWAGLAAVTAMGLGTALFTSGVAVSAVAARRAALVAGRGARMAAGLQVAAGVLIVVGAATLLAAARA